MCALPKDQQPMLLILKLVYSKDVRNKIPPQLAQQISQRPDSSSPFSGKYGLRMGRNRPKVEPAADGYHGPILENGLARNTDIGADAIRPRPAFPGGLAPKVQHSAASRAGSAQLRFNAPNGSIELFEPGSVVSFDIYRPSFGQLRASNFLTFLDLGAAAAARVMQDAFREHNIPLQFSYHPGNPSVSFYIFYDPFLESNLLADSFFPGTPRNDIVGKVKPYPARSVRISYTTVWKLSSVQIITNILLHEFGHVLGLRHQHAHQLEADVASVLWPGSSDEDTHTIMATLVLPESLHDLAFSPNDWKYLAEAYKGHHAVPITYVPLHGP